MSRVLQSTVAMLGLLALAEAPALAQEEAAAPTDPRMIEANSLLSDREQYDHAVELYRQVLADDPGYFPARLWLARVLSWDGETDASVVEYDRLLTQPGTTLEIEIERAEVLSWGGRYDAAEQAFEEILARVPGEPRASRGLARVYLWSGRRNEALRAYQQALALQEDPEARRELEELEAGLVVETDLQTRYFSDSDGFDLISVRLDGSLDLSFDTRLVGSVGYTRIQRDFDPFGSLTDANAIDFFAGVEHRPIPSLKLRAELGGRFWDEADDRVLARGSAEWSLPSNTALGFEVDHGDFLSRSDSFRAVIAGLSATAVRATAWQGYRGGFSSFLYLDSAFVSDGNARISVGLNGAWRPWSEREIELGAALSALTYTQRSILYYDPEIDFGANVSARGFAPLPHVPWLGLGAEVRLGLGYTEEGGVDGVGFIYSVGGGARIRHRGLWLDLWAGRLQTRRATTYTADTFTFSFGMDF